MITEVISKTINERFCTKPELFFLKTPKINKNIIDSERNISGVISSKFVILINNYIHTVHAYQITN